MFLKDGKYFDAALRKGVRCDTFCFSVLFFIMTETEGKRLSEEPLDGTKYRRAVNDVRARSHISTKIA